MKLYRFALVLAPSFFAFGLPGTQQQLTEEQSKQIALAAINELRLSGAEYAIRGIRVETLPGSQTCVVTSGGVEVWVDRADGRIRSFKDLTIDKGKAWQWPADAYSKERITEFAQKYMNAAGIDGPAYVANFAREPGDCPPTYFVRVTPLYRGIPYEPRHGSEMWLDANSGKILESNFRPIPRAPVSMEVRLTEEQARAVMVSYLFSGAARASRHKWPVPQDISTLREVVQVHLCLSQPPLNRGNPDVWFDEDDLADAHAGRARLVYFAEFDAPEYPGRIGLTAYVDARSGRLAEVETYFPMGGSASAPTKGFSWDSWKGDFQLRTGEKAVVVKGAAVKCLDAKRDSSGGVPVVLVRKGSALLVAYDQASRVLFCEYRGKRLFGKPNKALAKALDRLVAAR